MNKGELYAGIKILDHGYLALVDSMGTDESIIEAARMSTGRGFVSWDEYWRCKDSECETVWERDSDVVRDYGNCKCGSNLQHFPRGDLGLLERLWSGGHATPFEMCQLVVEVQAPIMVFREWHRHRTQGFSEFSARYAQMPNLHYVPELSRVQKQSATNKQSSGEALTGAEPEIFLQTIRSEQEMVYDGYEEAIDQFGIAKEVARINTPVSRYSKMRATANLRNWLGFLKLRLDGAAQYEIRMYAEALAEVVKALWPRSWALFEEHTLHAVTLSRSEAAALRELAADPVGETHDLLPVSIGKKLGL